MSEEPVDRNGVGKVESLSSGGFTGSSQRSSGPTLVDSNYVASDYVALIDHRKLERECLAQALNFRRARIRVVAFEDLAALQSAQGSLGQPRAVLFNAGSNNTDSDTRLEGEASELVTAVAPTPVVVLSENQDLSSILSILALGARGYIPSSVGIDVCIEAIALAIAGGKFIPASSVIHMRKALDATPAADPALSFTLTERQAAVAEALRQGKANKDIALELDLSESTVKVHIRSIMKKLGATNRTQVAYKICGGPPPATVS